MAKISAVRKKVSLLRQNISYFSLAFEDRKALVIVLDNAQTEITSFRRSSITRHTKEMA